MVARISEMTTEVENLRCFYGITTSYKFNERDPEIRTIKASWTLVLEMIG